MNQTAQPIVDPASGELSPTLVQSAEKLSLVLRQMCEEQQRLLELAEAHGAAIRAADGTGLERISTERSRILGQIEELNRQRLACVVPWHEANAATLAAIAQRLPENTGNALLAVGTKLRALVEAVQAEHRRLQDVTRRVGDHLAGVTRSMTRAASGHGGYSRFGHTVAPAGPVSTLDVRR